MAEQALQAGAGRAGGALQRRLLLRRAGRPERAIDLLERAVHLGWGDRAWMEHDSDLDPQHAQLRRFRPRCSRKIH
jgi:adenylate cyclase